MIQLVEVFMFASFLSVRDLDWSPTDYVTKMNDI